MPSNRSGRLKLREPEPFKGKTLKEARDFVRTLELVFALAGDAYATDRERTLYGVMFLAGEPRENWHHMYSVTELDDYSWSDFKRLIYDSVEDPTNRSLSVTVAYENARQGENQSTHAFATELATLEEQMTSYTPEQRTRHLLAKLRYPLRTAIIIHYEVPSRRQDLVSLATRRESAGKKDAAQPKRPADDSQAMSRNFKKARKEARRSDRPATAPSAGHNQAKSRDYNRKVTCWNCNEEGHYQTQCTKPKKVDRVDAGESHAKSKRKGKEKDT